MGKRPKSIAEAIEVEVKKRFGKSNGLTINFFYSKKAEVEYSLTQNQLKELIRSKVSLELEKFNRKRDFIS